MDSFALGLEIADRIIQDGKVDNFIKQRYSSFDSGSGKDYEDGKLDLVALSKLGEKAVCKKTSGKQEYLKNLINSYMFK